jgi:hypothetical protein
MEKEKEKVSYFTKKCCAVSLAVLMLLLLLWTCDYHLISCMTTGFKSLENKMDSFTVQVNQLLEGKEQCPVTESDSHHGAFTIWQLNDRGA